MSHKKPEKVVPNTYRYFTAYSLHPGGKLIKFTLAGSGKVGPVYQVNHTSWVAVVTLTDRPKSVRNRCVIELFRGVVCVVTLPL